MKPGAASLLPSSTTMTSKLGESVCCAKDAKQLSSGTQSLYAPIITLKRGVPAEIGSFVAIDPYRAYSWSQFCNYNAFNANYEPGRLRDRIWLCQTCIAMIHRRSDAYNSTEVPIALGLTWIHALKTAPHRRRESGAKRSRKPHP